MYVHTYICTYEYVCCYVDFTIRVETRAAKDLICSDVRKDVCTTVEDKRVDLCT